MAGIDLCDIINIESLDISRGEVSDVDISVVCRGGESADVIRQLPPEDNLIVKAADRYLTKAGLSGQIIFGIEKNIPAGAGLGGGSADAAAVLKLLNSMTGAFTDVELLDLATGLGADVPFCLSGGLALCSGIGENVEVIQHVPDLWVVVANDSVHVNTSEAYMSLARTGEYVFDDRENDQVRRKSLLFAETGDVRHVSEFFLNDFEEPVFSNYPEIKELKERVRETGAEFVIMSGSGSSIAGLYPDEDHAASAFSSLKGKCGNVYLTKFK